MGLHSLGWDLGAGGRNPGNKNLPWRPGGSNESLNRERRDRSRSGRAKRALKGRLEGNLLTQNKPWPLRGKGFMGEQSSDKKGLHDWRGEGGGMQKRGHPREEGRKAKGDFSQEGKCLGRPKRLLKVPRKPPQGEMGCITLATWGPLTWKESMVA